MAREGRLTRSEARKAWWQRATPAMTANMGTRAGTDVRLNLPIDPALIGYLAGLFDGEGSVVILRGKVRSRYRVLITNTDREVMTWLMSMGGTLRTSFQSHIGKKPVYVWQVNRVADVLAFLTLTLPYLRIKRAKATDVIDYMSPRMEVV